MNNKGFEFFAQLTPGAQKTQVLGIFDEEVFGMPKRVLKISVHSKPVNNKANIELIEFLAKLFEIAKSKIQIKQGQKSRRKLILIIAAEESKILSKLISIEKGEF